MRREEKRRKLQEAVLNILYPPAPSPPPEAEDQDQKHGKTIGEDLDVGVINPDDYLRSSTSNSDDDVYDGNVEGSEGRPEKLTRSQRKRLRKKKLKEDARRRRNIIGPLLPTTSDGFEKSDGNGGEVDSPGVCKNVSEECANLPSDKPPHPGELAGCTNQKKLKQRRMAKRLARDQLKLSSSENNTEDQNL